MKQLSIASYYICSLNRKSFKFQPYPKLYSVICDFDRQQNSRRNDTAFGVTGIFNIEFCSLKQEE